MIEGALSKLSKSDLTRALVIGGATAAISTVTLPLAGTIVVGALGAGLSALDYQRLATEFKLRDKRLSRVLRNQLEIELRNFCITRNPVYSDVRNEWRLLFEAISEKENRSFSDSGREFFSLKHEVPIKSLVYQGEIERYFLSELWNGPPLRVHCPALHPAAAAAFLRMRDYFKIPFEYLSFGDRLAIEVLPKLSAQNFDFCVVADSPIYLWDSSALLEFGRQVGHVTRAINTTIARRDASDERLRWSFYQPGTSAHEQMALFPIQGTKSEPMAPGVVDLTSNVLNLPQNASICIPGPSGRGFLTNSDFRMVGQEFTHETSLFASAHSDFYLNRSLFRAFLETFYGSLAYYKIHPNAAYNCLRADPSFILSFGNCMFGAKSFLK